MSDLISRITSLISNKKSDSIPIIKQYFTELCQKSPLEQKNEFQIIFDFINSESPDDTEQESLNRLLVTLSTIFSFPKKDFIGNLPFESRDPFLLSCLVLLHNMKTDIPEHMEQCANYAIETFESIGNATTTEFYCRTDSYFTRYLATSLKQFKVKEVQEKIINSFCNAMQKVKAEHINMHDLLFISQTLLSAFPIIQQHKNQEMANTFMKTLENLFEACIHHPSSMLITLFHPWFYFAKQISDEMRGQENGLRLDFSPHVKLITKAAEKIVYSKHHELQHQFQWFLLFFFYWFVQDPLARSRLLIFICQGLKSVHQIEKHRKVCQTVDKFNTSITFQYQQGDTWPMFFFIGNLHSQLVHYLKIIEDINGIKVDQFLPQEKEGTLQTTKYSFMFQTMRAFNDSIVDKTAYTLITERVTPSLEKGIEWFNEEVHKITKAKKKIMSIIPFQTHYTRFIAKCLEQPKGKSELFYFLRAANIWTEYTIIISHRFCELKKFHNSYIIFNREDNTMPCTSNKFMINVDNFTSIINSFTEILLLTPKDFIYDVANEITDVILKYIEIDMITVDFFELFLPIRQNETFLDSILHCLYSYVTENIKLMLSDDRHEANIIPKILAFVIRFCRVSNLDEVPQYYPSLLKSLKTYQRLIVTSIFSSIKRVSNQTDTLNAICTDAKIYSTLIQRRTGKIPNDLLFVKMKPLMFMDFLESTKFFAIPAFLEMISLDPENISLLQCTDIFRVCFSSNDSELISRATLLFCQLFNKDLKTQSFDVNNPQLVPIYSAMLSNMHLLSKQASLAVQSIIPFIPQIFTQPNSYEMPTCGVNVGIVNIDLLQLTHAIVDNYIDTEQNAYAAFHFVTYAMEIVKDNIMTIKHTDLIIPELLGLMMKSYVYKSSVQNLEEYYKHLVYIWGEIMADGISNEFFIECITLAATSRAHISFVMYQIANGILSHINSRDHSTAILHKTLEDIMTKKTNCRAHLIIMGLSLFGDHFMSFITRDHIKEFFYESTVISHIDYDLPIAANRFLKKYLAFINDEQKRFFVEDSLKILQTRSVAIRHVLIKRIRKLGITDIPNQENNILNLKVNSDSAPDYQILASQIALGTQITPETATKISDMIMHRLESVNINERLSRKNTLVSELVHSKDFFPLISTNPQLTQQTLNFLCNTLTSRFAVFRNAASKKFKIITSSKQKSGICFNTVDEYCNNPDKIFTFFSHQPDRICFYRRLVKLNADRIPPEIVKLFLKAYFDYAKLPDDEKLKNMCNLVQIIKTLTVKDYINREPVRKIILGTFQKSTYLEEYISKSIELLSSKIMPNRALILKHVCRFLTLFPDKTINYMFSSKLDDPTNGYSILTDLIILNETNELLLALINYLLINKNFSQLHPSAIQIFDVLADYEKYVITQDLAILTKTMFGDLLADFKSHEQKAENSYTSLELVASVYIKIIERSPTFETVIDFAKIFSNPMFYHSETYSKFIHVAFADIPPEFSASFLDFIITNNVPLSDVQFYVLISHAILHCGDVDEELIDKIWTTLIDRLHSEPESLCSSLKCVISLLKRWDPYPLNAKEITPFIIRGIRSGDCQTELYGLKAALLLIHYEKFPDVLFYSVCNILLSYQKFYDNPFKHLTYKFFNSRTDLYDDPPEDFLRSLIYFIHDKCTGTRETLLMLEMFESVPSLSKLVPFSLSDTFTLCVLNKLEKLNPIDNEMNEFDGLFNTGLHFIQSVENTVSDSEIKFFVDASVTFINKAFNTSKQLELCVNLFKYIKTSKPELFPSLFDVIEQKVKQNNSNFDLNAFSYISCACAVRSPELQNHPLLLDLAFQFIPKYYNLNLDDIWDILSYALEVKIPGVDLTAKIATLYQWFLHNFNQSNRDQACRAMRAYILSHPVDSRLDDIKEIWENVFENSMQQAPFRCLCPQIFFTFCICSLEFLQSSAQVQLLQYIIKRISNKKLENAYFMSAAIYVIKSEKVSNEAKMELISQLPYHVNEDTRELMPELIDVVLDYATQIQSQDCISSAIFLMISYANICSPKTRLLAVKRILQVLPEDPIQRIEYMMLNVTPEIWNDLYLPLVVLLCFPYSPEIPSLISFSTSLMKISTSLIHSLLVQYLEMNGNPQSVIEFSQRIKSIKPKRMHIGAITGITLTIMEMNLPISTNNLLKLTKISGLTNSISDIDPNIEIPDHIFEFILPFDSLYAKTAESLLPIQRSAVALTALGQYDMAQLVYSEISTSTNVTVPYFNSMMRYNNHMFISDEQKEKKEIDIPCLKRIEFQTDHLSQYVPLLLMKDLKNQQAQQMIAQCSKKTMEYSSTILRASQDSPIASKDRLLVALIANKIYEKQAKLTENSNIFALNAPEVKTSINPSFYKAIKYQQLKNRQLTPKGFVCVDEEPIFLSDPNNAFYKSIAGYNISGLHAVSNQSIQETFASMSINAARKETKDWLKYAPFCYNLYAVNSHSGAIEEDEIASGSETIETQLTSSISELFLTTFGIYTNLLKQNASLPFDRQFEVACRLLLLIRDAINVSSLSNIPIETIITNREIFSESNHSVWTLILPELIRLYDLIPNCQDKGLIQLITVNAPKVLLLSNILSAFAAKKVVMATQQGYTLSNALDKSIKIYNDLFNIDFLSYERQKAIIELLYTLRHTDDQEIQNIKFENLRLDTCETALERCIAKSSINITSIQELADLKGRAIQEQNLIELAQKLSHSERSYEDIELEFTNVCDSLNAIHLEISSAIDPNQVSMINNKFTWLGENLVQMNFLFEKGTSETIIFQNVKNIDEEQVNHKNVLISSFAPLLTYLAGADFILHERQIPFNHIQKKFTIINGTAIHAISNSNLISLRQVYENYFHEDPSTLQSLPESAENILLKQIVNQSSQMNYVKKRSAFVAYLGIQAARNICNESRYPHLDEFIIDASSGLVIPLFNLTQNQSGPSSFRSSPVIRRIIGDDQQFKGEMTLALSAAFHSFIVNGFDSFCAMEELLASIDNLDLTINQIVASRNEKLEQLLMFCPPNSPTSDGNEATEWLQRIEELIDSSMNASKQPSEAMPWF